MGRASETRFAALQVRYADAQAREETYRIEVLLGRYRQMRPPSTWLTKTERGRLEAFSRAQDRAIEAMMTLLDQIGGRAWRRGAPVHWIMTELSYADAEATGPPSVVPPPPYGYTTREMEHFAAAVPEPERAAAGGRQ